MINNLPHPQLTFLFSICEEDGLKGAKLLEDHYLADIDYAYILDGEGPVGTAVVKTPHGCKGTLKIIGKEAHAGVCPEEGINALVVATEAISQLTIGRVDEETTCNFGVVHGGSATNVVMGQIELQFEARSYDLDKLIRLVEKVKKIFDLTAIKNRAAFEENLQYGTPGYQLDKTEGILRRFESACQKSNITYQEIRCGGGSNANVYRKRGVDAVNLSTNMKNIHSLQESIAVQDLKTMLSVLTNLIIESA